MEEEKTEKKNDTITIKKDQLWKYSTFALLGILILGVVIMALPGKNPTGNVIKEQGNQLPGQNERANLEIEDSDHFLKGNKNSKVTIIEYSDFECPFCARAYSDAVRQIKSNYKDNEVAIIYRDFPLNSIHPNAQKAGEAAECAGDQGMFIQMHDLMFERGVSGGVTVMKQYASEIGLDTGEFNDCLDSGKYASEVSDELQEGASLGVQGTPAFFVGNEKDGFVSVSGAQPFNVFKQLIDSQLS
jgi:protein-disulfide isomerase